MNNAGDVFDTSIPLKNSNESSIDVALLSKLSREAYLESKKSTDSQKYNDLKQQIHDHIWTDEHKTMMNDFFLHIQNNLEYKINHGITQYIETNPDKQLYALAWTLKPEKVMFMPDFEQKLHLWFGHTDLERYTSNKLEEKYHPELTECFWYKGLNGSWSTTHNQYVHHAVNYHTVQESLEKVDWSKMEKLNNFSEYLNNHLHEIIYLALVRFTETETFAKLNKTDDFKIIYMHYDDDFYSAVDRMSLVRQGYKISSPYDISLE